MRKNPAPLRKALDYYIHTEVNWDYEDIFRIDLGGNMLLMCGDGEIDYTYMTISRKSILLYGFVIRFNGTLAVFKATVCP